MSKPRWKLIPGCSNYAVGSNGKVKRLKHKSTGKLYRILDEEFVKFQMNRSGVVYVKIRTDEGGQKVFSIQKLMMDNFFEKGKIYYKIAPEFDLLWVKNKRTKERELVQQFNNRVDHFVLKETYDRMTYKPVIYKTVRT